jgi:hypothetical protein
MRFFCIETEKAHTFGVAAKRELPLRDLRVLRG